MSLKKKYTITKQIGTGSMAVVSKAIQKSLDRFVALKQLHPHLSKDPDYITRFEREAKAAAGLSHQNIMDIIDFGRDGEIYYIVSEYIDGPNLSYILQNAKKLPLDVVLSITSQILHGLEHAHNKGVIHRDLKPANIMITRNGIAKITDFGIAHAQNLQSLTQMGQVIGTPSFMSPEQAEGKSIDHRSDLFSVGVMLYNMLADTLPFDGSTVLDIMSKLVVEPHPPVIEHNPDVPEDLVSIVDKCLEKDMTRRFFDASEFAYALERLAMQSNIMLGPRAIKQYFEKVFNLADEIPIEEDPSPSHVRRISASTTGIGKKRPTAAILPLTGCFGCHINLLDLHEDILQLHSMIDIQYTYIMDVKKVPEVDIGLVEGCVANEENEERLKQLRERCTTLVALGTCATFGGLPGLRNLHSVDETIDRSYGAKASGPAADKLPGPPWVPSLLPHVRPVSEVVKVDAIIPGCPSPHDLIINVLKNAINGTPFEVPMHNLCNQCGRKHRQKLSGKREFITDDIRPVMELDEIDPELCFLEQGVLCMGLTTMEGCGGRCIRSNIPCKGCMGPAPHVKETGAKWVNAIGSMMPGGAIRYRHDLVGLAYRYTLPLSMMPYRKQ